MKILITGCNGFLGREFSEYFSKHELFLANRQNLDLSSGDTVDNFFNNNEVDMVLHTAIEGGRRTQIDTYDTMCKNLIMFGNIIKHVDKFKLMINFGSGAEFDRRRDISLLCEQDISDSWPIDYYGLSKRVITSEIYKNDNVFNMRLFGCFGPHEAANRFIKSSLNRLLSGEKILIHQNKYMDFFFVEDLCRVIDYYSKQDTNHLYKDLNMCYTKKQSLQDIANIICEVAEVNPSKNIQIQNVNNSGILSYTGDGTRLRSLKIDLVGSQGGIRKVYERIRQS